MTLHRCFLLLPLLASASCSPTNWQIHESNLKREVGRPVQWLVTERGPPTTVFPNGPVMIYKWTTHIDSESFRGPFGMRTIRDNECNEWFDVNDTGVVVASHWNGNCFPW